MVDAKDVQASAYKVVTERGVVYLMGRVTEREATRNGARLPVTALVDQFYADVQAQGGNRFDTSSLLLRLK